jgi:FMN phosphatase YigB (HAD superfamily)
MTNTAIFDAFGTIVRIAKPQYPYRTLYRHLPEHLRAIVTANLHPLTETYSFGEYFDAVVELAGTDHAILATLTPDLREELCEQVVTEVNSIEVLDSASSLLQTLRIHDVAIGVCSNLATPYVAPVRALFSAMVDSWCFSCEDGFAKPDLRIYRLMLERLGSAPGQAVMFGDTLLCDVQGPALAGISGYLVHDKAAPLSLADGICQSFPQLHSALKSCRR